MDVSVTLPLTSNMIVSSSNAGTLSDEPYDSFSQEKKIINDINM